MKQDHPKKPAQSHEQPPDPKKELLKKGVPWEQQPVHLATHESNSYLAGLFAEFQTQVLRYQEVTAHSREVEARVELTEKTLSLTRDHITEMVDKTEFATPTDWSDTLKIVRYVGVRLVDACVDILRRRQKVTIPELVMALNAGMFRFRTNSPIREIHGALMRQRSVRRTDEGWEWVGPNVAPPQGLKLVKAGSEG